MKRSIFLLFGLIFSFSLFAQQIEKELVVVEIATGTWCYYCPGGSMGADELVANFGDAVAIIKNHNGDDYAYTYSNARNNFNGVSGIPDSRFNGLNAVVGGSHTESMYPTFLPVYNSAMEVLTSFDINMEITTTDDINFDVTLTIDRVADYDGGNLFAQLTLTESGIEEEWQGMTELNFVNRDMYPSANGTSLDFSESDQQIIEYNFSVEEEWNIENCKIIAFIQDNTSKEILNGTKASMNMPHGTNNAMLQMVISPADTMLCGDSFFPVIQIKNKGSENLTSLHIEYDVNGVDTEEYDWTGDLAFGESEEISFDELFFSYEDENLFNVFTSLPNGVTDDEPENNDIEHTFYKSPETTTKIYLNMNTGQSFLQGISWTLEDSEGTVLYSGDGYTGSSVVNETFVVESLGCYNFTIENSFGGGFSEDGYYELTDSEGTIIRYTEGDFGYDETMPFETVTVAAVESIEELNINIYPNPTNSFINISHENTSSTNVKIYNILGEMVFDNDYSTSGNIRINASEFSAGVYNVKVTANNKTVSKKIIRK